MIVEKRQIWYYVLMGLGYPTAYAMFAGHFVRRYYLGQGKREK